MKFYLEIAQTLQAYSNLIHAKLLCDDLVDLKNIINY